MTRPLGALRPLVKASVHAVCVALVAVPALMSWVEARLHPHGEGVFAFWAHVFALGPGLPGVCLRRAFYQLTLDVCTANFIIGFGAIFTHRRAEVEEDVYIGPYALIGSASLRKGCLIGSRASLLSGGALHALDDQGRWKPSDFARSIQIEVGEHAWIGEGAIIIASVGSGAMIAAGSVVASPVPDSVQMAGNPARFVRWLRPDGAVGAADAGKRSHEARILSLH